ncbi:MAG: hypothetical protein K2Y31_17895 [Burkholderiales bacterium]|jgi:hypothetical protein|nr:hypothetical protein [Burkholderiales bacterium]
MRNYILAASTLAACAAIAATPSFVLDDQPATAQQVAAYLVSVERPLQKNDLKGYCSATLGRPGVLQMHARMCQDAVRSKHNKPEDCTEARIKQHAKNGMDECLAMPAGEFAKAQKDFREGLEEFTKDAKAKGVDANKLLAAERAKLK